MGGGNDVICVSSNTLYAYAPAGGRLPEVLTAVFLVRIVETVVVVVALGRDRHALPSVAAGELVPVARDELHVRRRRRPAVGRERVGDVLLRRRRTRSRPAGGRRRGAGDGHAGCGEKSWKNILETALECPRDGKTVVAPGRLARSRGPRRRGGPRGPKEVRRGRVVPGARGRRRVFAGKPVAENDFHTPVAC